MSIWAVVSQYGLSVLLKKQVNLRNNTLAFLPEEFIIYATTVAERRFHEQEETQERTQEETIRKESRLAGHGFVHCGYFPGGELRRR